MTGSGVTLGVLGLAIVAAGAAEPPGFTAHARFEGVMRANETMIVRCRNEKRMIAFMSVPLIGCVMPA